MDANGISLGPSWVHCGLHVFSTVVVDQADCSRCTEQYGSEVPCVRLGPNKPSRLGSSAAMRSRASLMTMRSLPSGRARGSILSSGRPPPIVRSLLRAPVLRCALSSVSNVPLSSSRTSVARSGFQRSPWASRATVRCTSPVTAPSMLAGCSRGNQPSMGAPPGTSLHRSSLTSPMNVCAFILFLSNMTR